MKNLFLLILLVPNARFSAFGQAPDIIWQKCFGGIFAEGAYEIKQTSDNGFIIFGGSSGIDGDVTEDNGYTDYWVLKLDSNRNVEWQRSVGGSSFEIGASGVITTSGEYLMLGQSTSEDGDISAPKGASDFWLVKFSNTGELLWDRSYGGSGDEYGYCIINTQDGGFMMSGSTGSSYDGDVTGNHGNHDYWVVKLDENANIEWQKCYGGSDYDYANSIAQTLDGGYIIAGRSESSDGDVSDNYGFWDFWVVKIDPLGNIEWERNYGGTGYELACSVKPTMDGGFIVAGQTDSYNGDVSGFHGGPTDWWVLKLDSVGNINWQLPLGGTSAEEANVVIQVVDSGYIVAGFSISDNLDLTENFGESDFWVVKLDLTGVLEWQKNLGSSEGEKAFDIISVNDNDLVVAGYTTGNDFDVSGYHGPIGYGGDVWIVKLGYCNTVFYADADGDGFGDIDLDSIACNMPIGFVNDSTDCDDTNNLIFPTATDICNAIDDNCNGLTDEDVTAFHWFMDTDNDGFGDVLNDSVSCFTLGGFVLDSTDCNDANILIHPTAIEICNALDDNCNTDIDEGLVFYTFFIDADGDGFGDSDIYISSCFEEVLGYVLDSTDCNDANNNIYTGAEEICNYLDDDCDGIADDNLTYILSFEDADSDAYGNIAVDSLSCELPEGFVENNSDCDDANPDIYPGAPEILNGADDDCNGLTDEGLEMNNVLLSQLNVYPNPASETLNIEFSGSEKLVIEILNITGSIIFSTQNIQVFYTVNISKFAPGAYVLKLRSVDNEAAIVFVKE